ncbi:GNAT family N-acetyltransferase [Actinomycetospora flava]|uniref:GNAT family N-acetyltransferase n=1 Tax=Actinomycetospora flava TaxID=3129232 RepID=A0ABU8M5L1_9PSEU
MVRPDELGASDLDRWRSFQCSGPTAHPFLAPEFVQAVGRLRRQVRVAVMEDDGGTVGFFPFERGRLGYGTPPAPGLTDAHGLVHAPDAEWDPQELLRACGLSVWEFDHLVDGQKPFERFQVLRVPSPVMDLSGGYAAFRADVRSRSKSFLSELERKGRALGRDHGALTFTLGSADVDDLRRIMAWKSEQYRRTGRSDRFRVPWIRELLESLLTTRTDTFTGTLSVLRAGDTPIAGHFGLRNGAALAGWFPAFDAGFRRYSPGLLHHLMLAEHAAADGVVEIDMGRGAKGYKDCFRSRDLVVAEGRIVRRSPAAAVHWARREPVRRLRNRVLADPRLYRAADRVLKQAASVHTRVVGAAQTR